MRLTHASGVTVSDIESVQRQASHASGVPPQASGVPRLMRHASGVRRQASHASCVMRQASGVPRLMRHASGVRRPTPHASCVRRQASGVRRQAPPSGAALRPQPSFSRRPIVVMTGNERRHFPMLQPSDLRQLSCIAWGNITLLPMLYGSTGAIVRIKTAGGAFSSAARCCYSTKKGRHNAGPVHGD